MKYAVSLLILSIYLPVLAVAGCTAHHRNPAVTVVVSDDCRTGLDPLDPLYWPSC